MSHTVTETKQHVCLACVFGGQKEVKNQLGQTHSEMLLHALSAKTHCNQSV